MTPKDILRVLGALSLFAAGAAPADANVVTVNSAADTAADDGQCTLREAIDAANRNAASGTRAGECTAGAAPSPGDPRDRIEFRIPGTGPFVITPATALPYVTEAVLMDGYSQPGARANKLQSGNDAVLMLELRGDKLSPSCDKGSPIPTGAFQFVGAGASGSRLRGFAMGGFSFTDPAGVVTIFRASDVQVDGNFIGLDSSGGRLDNAANGVLVLNGAYVGFWGEQPTAYDDGGPGNLVGGPSPQERNVISANAVGILLGGQRNRVEGNYIGVTPQGDASLPNRGHAVVAGRVGILDCADPRVAYRFDGADNTIGGRGNFFSAEGGDCAVQVTASGNQVVGNRMGTDRDGGAGPSGFGLGAQPGCGVLLERGGSFSTVAYNTIAFNDKGVVVRAAAGTVPKGNDIRANSIHSNASLGIDLANDGVTANDAGDADTGPNGLQNFPEKMAATPAGVRGLVRGKPNTELRVDFYRSPRCDASGNGEGETYLGNTSVLTDARGDAAFNVSLAGLTLEQVVTATATSGAEGTSELSACAPIRSGTAAQVELRSSHTPVRSRDTFVLTVDVRGSGGIKPKGLVRLYDVGHSKTLPGGQTAFEELASGTLDPSHPDPDVATLAIPASRLRRVGSQWGNLRIRAQFDGDATYAATASMDLVQTVYREKSDLDGDGLTDLVLCDPANDKLLVQASGATFLGPFPLAAVGKADTVLGTGEFGFNAEPSVVWRDASGAVFGTTFSGASPKQSFDIPLPAGLIVEGLGSMFGDLKDDVVVRDAAGQHSGVLTVDIASGTLKLASPWPVGPANGLHVEHVGDFDGDGNLDWLSRDPSSGSYLLWRLDGGFKVAGASALAHVPSGGTIAATGDLNGDGRTDIVWRLPTGDYEVALQDGAATVGQSLLPLAGSAGHPAGAVVGTAFLDPGTGDSGGRASLIVRQTMTSILEAWINTGTDAAGLPVFGSVRAVPTGGADLTTCAP